VGYVKDWGFSLDELDEIVEAHPSLRGMIQGYLAEYAFRKHWLNNEKRISDIKRWDNHDRNKKGDVTFTYKGVEIITEVKSLQSNMVKQTGPDTFEGKTQCDASDSREIELSNGDVLKTTCLRVGEFDVLAVNLFEFGKKWRFAFAVNDELPRSKYRKYTPEQRDLLLATLMEVTWPPEPPFEADLFAALDKIVKSK